MYVSVPACVTFKLPLPASPLSFCRDGNHRAVAFSLHLLEALAPSPQRAELIPRECHGGGAGSAAAAHGFDFDCLVDVVVGISPTAEHHVVPNEMFCLFR